jgi:hypothetical protein
MSLIYAVTWEPMLSLYNGFRHILHLNVNGILRTYLHFMQKSLNNWLSTFADNFWFTQQLSVLVFSWDLIFMAFYFIL